MALVGSSGSGKSTCVQLLERFYDPLSGQILLDGMNINEVNIKSLRQHIGLVSQEPVLFGVSIFQNVAWGSQDDVTPTLDDVIKACKLANAHESLVSYRKAMTLWLGRRVLLSSGGQKQRIAIARALIKQPKSTTVG